VTMIGLDVTHKALITEAHANELRTAGRVGKLTAELLDFYGRFHRRAYTDMNGSPMHDPVAVAHVISPGLVEVRPARIEVDCGWEQGRGRTNVDWRGRIGSGEPNAEVGFGIDADAFARLLIERIGSLG
jgi:inosine-uridine nucleoside N-ribohydrolase